MKKIKTYVTLIFTVVLTIATVLSQLDNYFTQRRLLKLSEIPFRPDFRVKTWFTDTINCDGKKDILFAIELRNEGYKVEINYIHLELFLEVFREDTFKIIPVSDGICVRDPEKRTGILRSYRGRDVFEIFKTNKDRTVEKIKGLFREDQPIYGAQLKYVAMISYKDNLSNDLKTVHFKIDKDSWNELTYEEGDNYFEIGRKSRMRYRLAELYGDVLGQLMLN
ncbi:MAG: hypothetical protein JST69_11530 [Bacteroidetes bacterium]|nr:hypothetical protein [Bacteroidota bacterium]